MSRKFSFSIENEFKERIQVDGCDSVDEAIHLVERAANDRRAQIEKRAADMKAMEAEEKAEAESAEAAAKAKEAEIRAETARQAALGEERRAAAAKAEAEKNAPPPLPGSLDTTIKK